MGIVVLHHLGMTALWIAYLFRAYSLMHDVYSDPDSLDTEHNPQTSHSCKNDHGTSRTTGDPYPMHACCFI